MIEYEVMVKLKVRIMVNAKVKVIVFRRVLSCRVIELAPSCPVLCLSYDCLVTVLRLSWLLFSCRLLSCYVF